MIYISLPIFTQPAVVLGQLRNFSFFFPEATAVLHISANASFDARQFMDALDDSGLGNALVNPERLATGWGNILLAHVSNICFIRSRGNATQICLHASDDMLVRKGVANWLNLHQNFFNYRRINPGTNWRYGRAALEDECLARICKQFGNARLIGSQLEGSCYSAPLLYDIADIISGTELQPPRVAYPREEVWLSTLACALGAYIQGSPYIFSEYHSFDRVYWRVLKYINPLIGTRSSASDVIRRSVETGMTKTGFHRIDKAWVDTIANDDHERLSDYEFMSDGNSCWRVYEPHGLFGVKRVPRQTNDPLRRYIDAMASDTVRHKRMALIGHWAKSAAGLDQHDKHSGNGSGLR
jgi:hypothetical protein